MHASLGGYSVLLKHTNAELPLPLQLQLRATRELSIAQAVGLLSARADPVAHAGENEH